jgi:hypothetical protein
MFVRDLFRALIVLYHFGVAAICIAVLFNPMWVGTPGRCGVFAIFIGVTGSEELARRLAPAWYRRQIKMMAFAVRRAYRTVACLVRGHDMEPEVTRLQVVELPRELPAGPPTSAYRQIANDGEPMLGLMVSRGRHCRRCRNTY